MRRALLVIVIVLLAIAGWVLLGKRGGGPAQPEARRSVEEPRAGERAEARPAPPLTPEPAPSPAPPAKARPPRKRAASAATPVAKPAPVAVPAPSAPAVAAAPGVAPAAPTPAGAPDATGPETSASAPAAAPAPAPAAAPAPATAAAPAPATAAAPAPATAAAPAPATAAAPAPATAAAPAPATAAAPAPATAAAPAPAPATAAAPAPEPPPAPQAVEPPAAPAPAAPTPARDAATAIAAAMGGAEASLESLDDGDAPEEAILSGAIAGTVLDAQGAPVRGVTLLALAPDGTDGNETFTDDDGEFVLPGLRPGSYAVFTGLGTPLASRIGGRSVRVKSTTVTRVQLREPADAASVTIEAVDADGRRIEGEAVLISGQPGENGSFRSLLASEAIYLPELGARRSALRVPPGVYTLVVLQGTGMAARASAEPVRVRSSAPLELSVQLGGDGRR